MSASPLSKDVLETITTWAEVLAQAFGILAVVSGAVYFGFNRPLKTLEAKERQEEREMVAERIERNKVEAAMAQQRVELELSKQRERTATAERELLELRRDTATVQRVVRPRRIPLSVDDPAVQAKYTALNEFAGKRVFFFVAPDLEAQNFAADLWKVLKAANWRPETPRGMLGDPGITVYSGEFVAGSVAPDNPDWRAGTAVADLLNAVFEMSGLSTGTPIAHLQEKNLPLSYQEYARPPGTVAITIGLRDAESQLRAARKQK